MSIPGEPGPNGPERSREEIGVSGRPHRRGRVFAAGLLLISLVAALGSGATPAGATPVSYTHLTLPTTPYV